MTVKQYTDFSKKANFSENRKLGWRGLRESRDWKWNEPRLGLEGPSLWFGWLHWDQSSGLASASKPGSVCKPSILGQDLLGQKGSNRFDNIEGKLQRKAWMLMWRSLSSAEAWKLQAQQGSEKSGLIHPYMTGKGFLFHPDFFGWDSFDSLEFYSEKLIQLGFERKLDRKSWTLSCCAAIFFCFKLVLLRKLRNTKKFHIRLGRVAEAVTTSSTKQEIVV